MNHLLTEVYTAYYRSPLGCLKIAATDNAITELLFCKEKNEGEPSHPLHPSGLVHVCMQQLDEYFKGERKQFQLPLMQEGTTFQQSVWKALMNIPYGVTISYLELSRRLGNVKAIRAAASTNGKNRIAIVVPCHRVIGSNRDLTGYAGGLDKKKWLLEHELKYAHGLQTLF